MKCWAVGLAARHYPRLVLFAGQILIKKYTMYTRAFLCPQPILMKKFLKVTFFSFSIFLLSWILVYETGINELAIQSEDTLPAMFLPIAILKEKTLYLDSYYDMLVARYPHPDDRDYTKSLTPFYLRKIDQTALIDGVHYVSAFPLVAGLLAVPVYFLPLKLGVPTTWEVLIFLSHVAAGLIVSLSGGFLYLLLKRFFKDEGIVTKEIEKKSLILTAVYLFGTVNFAMTSQSLWQHGAVQLFTILGLLAFYRQKFFRMGLWLGLAVLSRPTAGLMFVLMGVLLFLRQCMESGSGSGAIRKCRSFVLGVVPVILFFLWYNKTYYLGLANQGYSSQIFTEWRANILEGFAGLWLSPSKGILIYSPVFVFSLVGFWQVLKGRVTSKRLDYGFFFVIVVLHTLILGKWKHWYGGYSYGYRMASGVLPFLILLMVPALNSEFFEKSRRFFWILFGCSVLMELFGIVFFDGIWHGIYDTGFKDTRWLWSIKNSELAFNVKRVLRKMGIDFL